MATLRTENGRPPRFDFLGGLLERAALTHARAIAVLVVVSLLAFLPGLFSIPPVDRDEARFAQASRQMMETGDYVDIRFQDDARHKKPIGVYWLQTASVNAAAALGKQNAALSIGLYRIPSLLGALAAVLLTYWTALVFVSRRASLLAALMLATSVILAVEAHLAKTDAVLLAAVVAVMGAMARIYFVGRDLKPGWSAWRWPAVFWTALAVGTLVKGPLIFGFVGAAIVTLAVLDRSARWLVALRPLAGILWFALLVCPWFFAISARSGAAFASASIGQDLLPKLFSGQEGHGALPGYYFLLFWATFWPAATLAGVAAPAVWASRHERGARFLLSWLVPSWLVLELVITKLPHYVMPLYPAIAILIAGVVDSHRIPRKGWMLHGTAWWFVFPVLLGGLALAAIMMFGRQMALLSLPLFAGAIVLGLLAWRLFEADGPVHSLQRAMVASVLISIGAYGLLLPMLGKLFPSVTLARVLRTSDCDRPLAASAGFHEPSLVFLAGTATRLVDGTQAAEFLNMGGCRYAFVESRQERAFLRRADAIRLRYSSGPRVEGYNHNAGRSVTIAVYRSETGS
jgi:4-amino-4-deoxy-L-arabinose transferase-like glycosyltransferase